MEALARDRDEDADDAAINIVANARGFRQRHGGRLHKGVYVVLRGCTSIAARWSGSAKKSTRT